MIVAVTRSIRLSARTSRRLPDWLTVYPYLWLAAPFAIALIIDGAAAASLALTGESVPAAAVQLLWLVLVGMVLVAVARSRGVSRLKRHRMALTLPRSRRAIFLRAARGAGDIAALRFWRDVAATHPLRENLWVHGALGPRRVYRGAGTAGEPSVVGRARKAAPSGAALPVVRGR